MTLSAPLDRRRRLGTSTAACVRVNGCDAMTDEQAMIATPERDHLTGITTEVRASDRSDMDMEEAGDVSSDTSVAMAMVMTPISADTASSAIPEPMQRHRNRLRWRSETPAAALGPGDWTS